jgi:hypothetical protein
MMDTSIDPTRAVVKQPWLAVKFWWDGYDPARAFELFVAETVPLEARSVDPTWRRWQSARPGTLLEEVRNYMVDHDLRILSAELIRQRRQPRWSGMYVVQIGKELRA